MTGLLISSSIIIALIVFITVLVRIEKKRKIEKVFSIKNDFPNAFEKFCKEHKIKESSIYDFNKNNLNEILKISLDYWISQERTTKIQKEEIRKIYNEFNRIKVDYPNGLNTWLKINNITSGGSYTPRGNSLTEVKMEKAIREKEEIEKYEIAHSEFLFFDKWENEQKTFTALCRDKRNSLLNGFGCCHYYPNFVKTNEKGEQENGNYKVWQFYSCAYCLDKDLDYSYCPYYADSAVFVEEHWIYCNDTIANKIVQFILSIKAEVGDICIYFRDARNEWSNYSINTRYSLIYDKLKNQIDSSCIYINNPNLFSDNIEEKIELYKQWLDSIKQRIVIIDYATENEELIQFCEKIIVEAKKKKPLITYISLLKGHDKAEMQKIINKKKKEVEKEEEPRQKKLKIEDASHSWPLVKGIHHYFFFYYYPTRFENVSNLDQHVRQLIWNFKDGIGHFKIREILVKKLKQTYGDALDMLTFVCIPASTKAVNERRYEKFMKNVCEDTQMKNGYSHITITKEKQPSHLGGETPAEYSYDKDFFKDSLVILFDDVVTRGHSIERMKNELQDVGATVVAALSIGRTYWGDDSRQPHPYIEETSQSLFL